MRLKAKDVAYILHKKQFNLDPDPPHAARDDTPSPLQKTEVLFPGGVEPDDDWILGFQIHLRLELSY